MDGRFTNESDAVGQISRRMKNLGTPPLAITSFLRNYSRLVNGWSGSVPGASIEPLTDVNPLAALGRFSEEGKRALSHTAIIKLNGGLGTSMGLEGPKSLLPVKQGHTFLDIVIEQAQRIRHARRCDLPLILMDSFNTHDETVAALDRHTGLQDGQCDLPLTFVQHRAPKIRQDNLLPVEWPQDPSKEWCPPGHGDLYLALVTTGLLDRMRAAGIRYLFVSNIDNLGATLDLSILGYMAAQSIPFLMEVTERTETDRKGGHLARTGGHLLLRELAQCPPEEEQDFQDIRKYRHFNTNNLWIDLDALAQKLAENGGMLDLPLIVNRKTVDSNDASSPAVFQLETAMGAALSVFDHAEALLVPRTRFAPVKTTADLLALWSDAYVLSEDMHIIPAPKRNGIPPLIQLDPTFYGALGNFRQRFQLGAPSMVDCDSLTIEGDIRFGRNTVLRGRVQMTNPDQKQMTVPDGTVISGNNPR